MADCIHRWAIATPHGPYVWGYCKRCGETRSWPASTEDALTFGQAGALALAQRKAKRG